MENKNFACRVFKEQIELILQLPENERAEVLYKAILYGFNQIDCQFENQNESAYVSVSDSVSILSKKIFNLLRKNITWKEFSNNYGGKRTNSGAPKGNTNAKKNNQIDCQNDYQIDCQIDCQNDRKKPIDMNTIFQAGGQGWVFPPKIRKLALTRWTESELRGFEKEHCCHEQVVDMCLNDLPEPKPKIKRFVKPTVEEIKAYCQERNNNIDADQFFNYYEGNGWKVGKNPMKDWKAVVRTWEKNNFNQPKKQEKINWGLYVGDGSFLRNPKDDPLYADIVNKKD